MNNKSTILIIDDVPENIEILFQILNNDYKIVAATSAKKGLIIVKNNPPDLILLDLMMPEMNGYEFMEQFNKEYKGEIPIPVIFVTAKSNEYHEDMSLLAGSSDYITKPINAESLKSRIKPHIIARELLKQNIKNKQTINNLYGNILYEQITAKKIYDNIINKIAMPDIPNTKLKVIPKDIFCDDILLIGKVAEHEYNIMLGEFTGPKLISTLSYIATIEAFITMSQKGMQLKDIICELNNKLHIVLPRHIYFTACIISVNFQNNTINIWNSWQPDSVHLDNKSKIVSLISSYSLPLGVGVTHAFNPEPKKLILNNQDKILIFSNGLPRAINNQHEFFSMDNIISAIEQNSDPNTLFENILLKLANFKKSTPQNDDITLFEITMNSIQHEK